MASRITELSKYRYDKAIEELDNAKLSLDEGRYRLALNRSYYAMFHAIRAVNALDEFDSRKHRVSLHTLINTMLKVETSQKKFQRLSAVHQK